MPSSDDEVKKSGKAEEEKEEEEEEEEEKEDDDDSSSDDEEEEEEEEEEGDDEKEGKGDGSSADGSDNEDGSGDSKGKERKKPASPKKRRVDSPGSQQQKVKKKRRYNVREFLDVEAEVSGDEDEEDEGEEGGEDGYDMADGFIAPDEEVETEEQEARRRREPESPRRKTRRIRRGAQAEMAEVEQELRELHDEGYDDEDYYDPRQKGGREKKKEREKEPEDMYSGEEDDESDMNDFIEDDLGDEDYGYGRRPKMRRRLVTAVDRDQMDDLIGVFGENFLDGEEAEEIDEDGEKRGRKETEKTKESGSKRLTLQKMFEPAELKAQYIRAEDDAIRRKDIPERLQLRGDRQRVMNDLERDEEATWIMDQLQGMSENASRDGVKEAVRQVLEFIDDKYEVPYIWTYRKDYVHPYLEREHLWQIMRLDEKWELTQRRKRQTMDRIDRLATHQDVDASEEKVRLAEERVREKEANVELWRRNYQEVRDKRDMDDDLDTMAEADASLQEAERQHALAQTELQRLQEAMAQAKHLRQLGEAMSEDMSELVPETLCHLLQQRNDEDSVKDYQQYLALITLTSRARHSKGFDHTAYKRCRREKLLRRLAQRFTISAPALGQAVFTNRLAPQAVPTPDEDPRQLVSTLVTEQFNKPEDVLRATRDMLAMEIAYEPCIRQVVRAAFLRRASVTTVPTEKGKQVIDPSHQYHGLQYLTEKPLTDFATSSLFLKLEQAEKEGYLTISIRASEMMPGTSSAEFILKDLERYYQPLDYCGAQETPVRMAWGKERRLILEDALRLFLLPNLEAGARRMLRIQAQEVVIKEAAAKLREIVQTGPYLPRHLALNSTYIPPLEDFQLKIKLMPSYLEKEPGGLQVVSVCISPDRREPSFVVAVDGMGVARDFAVLPASRAGPDGDLALRNKLHDFIYQHRPHVVLVNGRVGAEAKYMKELRLEKAVESVYTKIRQEIDNPDPDIMNETDEWVPAQVLFVDESLAQIYARSDLSRKEFPDYKVPLKMAVAMARHVQDPLQLVTTLFTAVDPKQPLQVLGAQLLFLRLHPLQHLVNKYNLLRTYEEVIIDTVNDVGVDLNAVVENRHLSPLLTFVAGLGPRKAQALIKAVNGLGERVISRKQLIEHKILGPKVFANAVGFLRIRPHSIDQRKEDKIPAELEHHILDNTRIHYECYKVNDFAQQVCKYAFQPDGKVAMLDFDLIAGVMQESLDVVKNKIKVHIDSLPLRDDGTRDLNHERLLFEIDQPDDDLKKLTLEPYVEHLQKNLYGRRRLELEMIKTELRFPFRDKRYPLRSNDPDNIFEMLTGQTDETLYPGVTVTARVVDVREKVARCRVQDFNITGFLSVMDYPAVPRGENMNDYLQPGAVIDAVVVVVEKDRLSVKLSCNPHDWQRPQSHIDKTFDFTKAQEDYDRRKDQLNRAAVDGEKAKAKTVKQKVETRIRRIDHINYKDMNFEEAAKYLKDAGQVGSYIYRPSSSGGLAITWLFCADVIKHVNIKEVGKGPSRKFFIDQNEYESLDQIDALYMTLINDLVTDMLGHRKYRGTPRPKVESELKEAYKVQPRMFHYLFYPDVNRPGCFAVSHIMTDSKTRRGHLQKEVVEVTPDGFRYRGQMLRNTDEVANYLKRHKHDTIPGAPVQWGRPNTSTAPPQPSSSSSAQPPSRQSRWGTSGGGAPAGGNSGAPTSSSHRDYDRGRENDRYERRDDYDRSSRGGDDRYRRDDNRGYYR